MTRIPVNTLLVLALLIPIAASAYPPAVGILGPSRSCTDCHASNGPWKDEAATIVDVLDATTRRSLLQPDGGFLLQVERGTTKKVITVIGRKAGDKISPPIRNAWLYVDPMQLDTGALSKFAPGWDVNLPMACRIVGDEIPEYPGAAVTALPMTVRAGDASRNAELELQVMLTRGVSAKGNPDAWLEANYMLKKLVLEVVDP
ncbi:MAG: hypothetical protein ABIK65_07970 [Candidatus Eisenbacteria bacterium]